MPAVIEYHEDNYSAFEWFEGLAVIRFYAGWCAPCVQNSPVFEQLAEHYAQANPEIKFGKVNIEPVADSDFAL